jgi:hypothetical protein
MAGMERTVAHEEAPAEDSSPDEAVPALAGKPGGAQAEVPKS